MSDAVIGARTIRFIRPTASPEANHWRSLRTFLRAVRLVEISDRDDTGETVSDPRPAPFDSARIDASSAC